MKPLIAIALCFVLGTANGQETSSEYFRYEQQAEYVPEFKADLSLFLAPIEGGNDIFTGLSMYNFSAVRYLRRGYDYRYTEQYVNGIDLSDAIDAQSNFSLISLTRKGRPAEGYKSGLSSDDDNIGGLCGIVRRSVRARDATMGSRISVNMSDRRYRWAMDVSSSGMTRDGKWGYMVAASRKFGRDTHVDGVFTDNYSLNISVDRVFSQKHAITFFAAAEGAEQGLRSSSTKEAFSLTGNNLYNPSWGYFMGDIRNSKVARNFQPIFIATYDATLSSDTKLTASVSYQFGRNYLSGMSWRNAQTPQPDYYRSMPGFFANQQLAEIVAKEWRSNNTDVTQINWGELSHQNMIADSEAIYLLEDRVEDVSNVQLAVNAQSRINEHVYVNYGVRLRNDSKNNYKQLKDLLGAKYMSNTDMFLTNEDSYSDPVQSDLRNPNRIVAESDRFGYDYDMHLRQLSGFARVEYRENHFRLSCGLEFGATTYWREGNYDKQSSADISSYGISAKQSFDNYKAKLSAGYSFSARQNIDATFMYGQQAASPYATFISPLYSNKIIDNPSSMKITAVEANYNMTFTPIKLKLSLFYTRTGNETEVRSYYDDISSAQSDLILSEVDKCYYGAELGADVPITKGLSLRLAASTSSFTYASDPLVNIVSEADLSPTISNQRSCLKNYRLGGTPQSVASAEIRYSGSYGWLATLAVNYMADNFTQLNPVRRMSRATAVAGSPEMFSKLVAQESIPSATTLNLFILKSFTIRRADFYVIGSVNNLLNNRDVIYSGYEQMRLRRKGNGRETNYAPFDSKYLYSYGRTYYFSINYKF